MTTDKAKKVDIEKLVQDIPLVSLDVLVSETTCTKKRIRRMAVPPHIEGWEKKGKKYYYYRRGADPPIYLGDADAILKAMKGD